jgi:RNA polymerase sigma-70 factor (sigma-E family)
VCHIWLVAYDAFPVARDLAAVVGEDVDPRPVDLASTFQANFRGLCRLAYLIVGDSSQAEDIVQEAFLKTFAGWRRLRDPDRLEVYLRRAVINASRSKLRRRGTERRANARAVAGEPREGRPDSDRSGADAVMAAVRLLPERQRATVLLRYYLDLPEVEIARTLGTTVGTVKSQLAKARRSLERALSEASDD